jgi:uncharacterized protein YciI
LNSDAPFASLQANEAVEKGALPSVVISVNTSIFAPWQGTGEEAHVVFIEKVRDPFKLVTSGPLRS